MIDPQVKHSLLQAVNDLQDELVKLTSDLIRIPSVNPTYPGIDMDEVKGGESRVNQFLKPVMESAGLTTDLWEEEPGRANLVGVHKGSSRGRSLIFNGHVDVVPPGPEALWTEALPWSGKVANGRVYGRGSTDMKGGVACTIIAMKALFQAGYYPKGDVILESVAGEEMMNTFVGTGATLRRGYRADAGIVVEPSGAPYRLAVVSTSPGALLLKITVKGKAAHTLLRNDHLSGAAQARRGVGPDQDACGIFTSRFLHHLSGNFRRRARRFGVHP
jgi:acetylornithine deacetylase/succinyl-diaminopimelate desuccinylase-like protein